MPSTDSASPRFTPRLPYLLSALVRWIEDNGCTPMLVASVEVPGVSVPHGYARDGLITFNIAEGAVQGLVIGDESVGFAARFGGRHFDVNLPLESLQAVYAREYPAESAVSLVSVATEVADFQKSSTDDDCDTKVGQASDGDARGRPNLRLVD